MRLWKRAWIFHRYLENNYLSDIVFVVDTENKRIQAFHGERIFDMVMEQQMILPKL